MIHRKVSPVCFPGVWSRCLLSALELVNERCRVSDSEKKKIQHLNVQVHRTVHEMLAYCVTYSLLQFDNDEFSFLMKNIYEYIHYIQSLKSIWTKIMSTWGCYFCCVLIFFFLNLFFIFVSLSPCEVCVCVYYFFLKKTLNVFQKNDKKTVLIPDFFFFSEDFKNGNKIQKCFERV